MRILHVLPPFEEAGHGGLCEDYDPDCDYEMDHYLCWRSDPSAGFSPYLD